MYSHPEIADWRDAAAGSICVPSPQSLNDVTLVLRFWSGVQGLGVRAWGLGFLEFWVLGFGFWGWVWGLGFCGFVFCVLCFVFFWFRILGFVFWVRISNSSMKPGNPQAKVQILNQEVV